MSKEIALDLKRYNTPEKLFSLPYDTASLAIEASSGDIPRVNTTYFVLNDRKVIAPGKDKRDVAEMFIQDESPETRAANKIIENLKNDPTDFTYTWISPSGPWPESRIEVGHKTKTKNGRFNYIKKYDISTVASPEMCLEMGQLLASIARNGTPFPQQADDLRDIIFKLDVPEGMNPFEYLESLLYPYIPEKDRFKSILDGTADKNKMEAIKVARTVTKPIVENPQLIYLAPKRYGAYIETEMMNKGYGMEPERFGCGGSNISTTTRSLSYKTSTITPGFDHEDRYGSLSFTCPKCGATNTRPFGQLISNCSHCGGDVRC